MRSFFLLLVICVCFDLFAQADDTDDGITKVLRACNDSTSCLVTKTIVFAPIFPWFLYPMDDKPTMPQIRRYEKIAADLDFGLMKANDHNSGYKFGTELHKQWLGLGFTYDTYNNGEFDQRFFSGYIVFRLSPRKHIQPKFLIGWKYIGTDEHKGGGFEISFFNYDITFSRRFSMFVVNYLSWIRGYTIIEGLVGLEYYVYPTISFKTSFDIRHVFSRLITGAQFGISVKM